MNNIKQIVIYDDDDTDDKELLFCEECDIIVLDNKKCDNCGDVLCEECRYCIKDDYYEDNDVVFCFQCWTEQRREYEEDEW
jgi:hypothetical protein